MDQKITTHILDTSMGRPANGVSLALWRLGPARALAVETITNDDGRTDAPLLIDEDVQPGVYELLFCVGAYFKRTQPDIEPLFDIIPIRFILPANAGKYHIPLLVSPFSYSTYRGS